MPDINWTLNAIFGVGKAINPASEVSFTVGNGIINKVFYPREDQIFTRDIGLLVTDKKTFFSDEKIDTLHQLEQIDQCPAFYLNNVCKEKKYCIEKEVLVDTIRSTIFQKINFSSLTKASLHLYFSFYLTHDSEIFLADYKGVSMLCIRNAGKAMAVSCSQKWKHWSTINSDNGDFFRSLQRQKILAKNSKAKEPKNTNIIGEIDIQNSHDEIIITIGFGKTFYKAANNAHASFLSGFSSAKDKYIAEWKKWKKNFKIKPVEGKYFNESIAQLKLNESKKFPGAIIASPAVPWEKSKESENMGYRLVWPRDLVECAGAFFFLEAYEDTLRILNYLLSLQESDGKWMQNYLLDGEPNWKGIQLDQIALPIILAGHCHNAKIIDMDLQSRYWPLIKKAISYLIINGPYTEEGRWEESQRGYSPYTMATEITALLYAARIAKKNNDQNLAKYLRETADYWNDQIEEFCYVTDTNLSKEANINGYYVRSNPTNVSISKNKNKEFKTSQYLGKSSDLKLGEIVSVDALALVRYGLRTPDDPRILNTIKVIDAMLKTNTKTGPGWHRFNYDGYGEHPDGSAYDGKGIGRLWPLLTGERAHYEIAAGNLSKAKVLLRTMESFSNHGLFSEQVWDSKDLPKRGLFFGRFTGSAMPLIWAHAEYIKLCLSIKENRVIDMPTETRERYVQNRTRSSIEVWRANRQKRFISHSKKLRIELLKPGLVAWSFDNYQTRLEAETIDSGIGIFYVDIVFSKQNYPADVVFTFFWKETQKWEKKDYKVRIVY